MGEESVIHRMEHWGYYALPPSHEFSPGSTGLLVAIREIPTGLHFDPEVISLWLQDDNDAAGQVSLRLRAPFRSSRQVCPGRVILCDRMGKQVEFFVFGGSLEATSVTGETVYSLRSPAPILELDDSLDSSSDQLAFETEVVLGEMRAKWVPDDEGFYQRLGRVDPLEFYRASLSSLLARCEHSQTLQETYQSLYHLLLEERRWLAKSGLWAGPVSLEGMLAPDWRLSGVRRGPRRK